jgi:catechol 2,3-dioxygenase-like lactoylglutathione lyase family enzyme
MQLGAFTISLAVRDINASKAFYEHLGFTQLGGDVARNWAILKNGGTSSGSSRGCSRRTS